MGTFRTKKLLSGNPSLIPNISQKIEQEFKMEKYEVMVQDLANGGKEVSLTKVIVSLATGGIMRFTTCGIII